MIVVMEGILWLLRFAVGACVFSFLNVVVYRLPKGEPMTWGRSHCPDCGRTLTARELIPCLSYLIQGKKCLGCGKKISARYFWVEAAGGMCFVFCGASFGCGIFGLLSLKGLIAFVYLGLLTVISLIDWDTKMINDRFQIGIVLLGLAALCIFPEHTLMDRLIGAVIIALPMLLLALAVAGAFGGGDIKLMAASGFLLGWRAVLVAMFLGLLAGSIYAIWLLSRKKLKGKDQIAFGPFLSFGLGVALFYGDRIADWYLSIL